MVKKSSTKKSQKQQRLSLGLMSGTSMDAIDAALVLTERGEDTLLLHRQFSYPKELRTDLLVLLREYQAPLEKITSLHYAVGEAFAAAATNLLKEAKKKRLLSMQNTPLLIGSHGQTIFHNPEVKQTMQIGEGSIIAARTGFTTVSDFRMADTAVDGEGAPLLPFYHAKLFAKKAKLGIAVHNLGGISNFTYLGPKGKFFALDTGPANCLIDVAITTLTNGKSTFDPDGAFAARGATHKEALDFLMQKESIRNFLEKPAPKSTGRELFSLQLLEDFLKKYRTLSLEDTLATLSAFTVETMRMAYSRFILEKRLPLKEVIFCGGGTRNAHIISSFQSYFPMLRLSSIENHGIKPEALEAQAFGIFAWMALDRIPITSLTTTGAKKAVICGKISYGEIARKSR